MRKQTNKRQLMAGIVLLAALFGASCKKEISREGTDNQEKEGLKTEVSAVNSSLNLNWENRTNGSAYTNSQASADFGNVSGWQESRAFITNGKNSNGLRITLLPNALSSAGGMVGNVNLNQGSAYELDYDVKFHSNFNFSKGGKIGFGLAIGEGNTGGDPGWDGNGGTLRLMWYSSSADRVFFQPYVYHKDQPTKFGDTYTNRFPASGSLQKGVWYHVHMYVKSNTGSSTNGRAQITINGTTILDNDIRWTTNDSQRLINKLTFHTFRGGSQEEWKANTTDYIYYDNLVVNKIN